jgi:hypothetical protein
MAAEKRRFQKHRFTCNDPPTFRGDKEEVELVPGSHFFKDKVNSPPTLRVGTATKRLKWSYKVPFAQRHSEGPSYTLRDSKEELEVLGPSFSQLRQRRGGSAPALFFPANAKKRWKCPGPPFPSLGKEEVEVPRPLFSQLRQRRGESDLASFPQLRQIRGESALSSFPQLRQRRCGTSKIRETDWSDLDPFPQ